MLSQFKYFCCVMSVTFLSTISPIYSMETNNLETLLEISNEGTLVLTDITNTLYKPCNTMSDKAWRTYMAERVREIVLDSGLAEKIANNIENKIVNEVAKELVYENAPMVVETLQKRKIPVIVISKKRWSSPYDKNFGMTTSNHLKNLKIDLERSVPLIGNMKQGSESKYGPIPKLVKEEEYTFAQGIIFTNKKPTDKALDAFLNRLEKKPIHIIVLDSSIQTEEKEKFELIGKTHNIALTFLQHQANENQGNQSEFDPDLGTIEFLEFMKNKKVILDEEAKTIKKKNPSTNYAALLQEFIKENTGLLLNN